MRVTECQSLGGGMGLGFKQAGFHSQLKVEQAGGFGFPQYEANRHLLGEIPLVDGDVTAWPVEKADVVFGCPPCSGFSMMSVRAGSSERRDYRGANAPINSCMHDLVDYAARCDADYIIMESVPTAGKDNTKAGGRGLMQQLREHAEKVAGKKYDLYHCFHNGAALGGASVRRRYFMVLAHGPFGVHVPMIEKVAHMSDVLGDLPEATHSDPTLEFAYAGPASFWSANKRNSHAVNGLTTFFDLFDNAHGNRVEAVLKLNDWKQGDQMVNVLQRSHEAGKGFPESSAWDERARAAVLDRPLAKAADYDLVQAGHMTDKEYCEKWKTASVPPSRPIPFQGGAYQPTRWYWNRAGRVMAGNGLTDIIHPIYNRTLTYREAARIMGFPDNWDIQPYTENRGGAAVFGKAVVVESAKWIADSVAASINNGDSDLHKGEETNIPREFVIDISNTHRDIYNERTGERKERA